MILLRCPGKRLISKKGFSLIRLTGATGQFEKVWRISVSPNNGSSYNIYNGSSRVPRNSYLGYFQD